MARKTKPNRDPTEIQHLSEISFQVICYRVPSIQRIPTKTRRRMARERRGAGPSLVSMEMQF